MSNNHNDTHRKKRGIKEYTTTKKHKVFVDGHLVTSYDDLELARQCARVLSGKVLSPKA